MLFVVLNTNSNQITDSHLTKFIVYYLEAHNTDRARPYDQTFSLLSNLSAIYDRDLPLYEVGNLKKILCYLMMLIFLLRH